MVNISVGGSGGAAPICEAPFNRDDYANYLKTTTMPAESLDAALTLYLRDQGKIGKNAVIVNGEKDTIVDPDNKQQPLRRLGKEEAEIYGEPNFIGLQSPVSEEKFTNFVKSHTAEITAEATRSKSNDKNNIQNLPAKPYCRQAGMQ